MATTQARDKYFLRSLHEEIGLFDRKLAHLLKYDTFASDKDRDAAADKMSAKREQLVRTARQLAKDGIEFKPSELPLSLRSTDPSAATAAPEVHAEAAAEETPHPASAPAAATYDAPVHDLRQDVKEYLQKRRKAFVPSATA